MLPLVALMLAGIATAVLGGALLLTARRQVSAVTPSHTLTFQTR
jgi:hypothetical protein